MRTVLDYVLEQPIRAGRTTTVHRARRQPGDERVALKLASIDLPADEVATVQLRLRQEAAVLAAVHHPNLVPLVDVLEIPIARGRLHRYGTPSTPATEVGIVLAWAAGGSLSDAITAGSIPSDRVAGMALQLAGALAALHLAGFVHGDISPGNVLRVDEDRWWLADLGQAGPIGAPPPGPRRGTDGYMAPEVLDGAPVDEAADVFALGSVIAAAIGISSATDDPTTDLVGELVHGAVSADPSDRPSAADLEQALEGIADRPDRPSPPRPPPPGAHGPVPAREPGAETREFLTPLIAVSSTTAAPPRRRGRSLGRASALGAALVVAAALLALVLMRPGSTVRSAALSGDGAASPIEPPAPAVLHPEPCPGSATEAPPGAVAVPGDPDGVGCTIAVLWWPDRAEAERPDATGARHRFSMGRPGDQLLLGDWDGDGRDTPALYDPSTGTVSRFDGWARSGEPLPGAVVTSDAPLGGLARVDRSADADQVQIDP